MHARLICAILFKEQKLYPLVTKNLTRMSRHPVRRGPPKTESIYETWCIYSV